MGKSKEKQSLLPFRDLQSLKRLFRYVLRYWRIPIVLFIFSGIYTFGTVGQAFIGKVLLDDVLTSSEDQVSMSFDTAWVDEWAVLEHGKSQWSLWSAKTWLRGTKKTLSVTRGEFNIPAPDGTTTSVPFYEGDLTSDELDVVPRDDPQRVLRAMQRLEEARLLGDRETWANRHAGLGSAHFRIRATDGRFEVALSKNRLTDDRWSILKYIGLAALVIAFLTALGNFGKEYLVWHIHLNILVDIRTEVCHHLLRQPLRYFHDNRTGELMSRVTNDTAALQKAVGFMIGDMIQHPVRIIGAFATAVWLSWQLALVIFVCFPILTIPIVYVGRILRKQSKRGLENAADISSLMQQMFTGIWIIKAFRLEQHQDDKFQREMDQYKAIGYRWIGARAIGRSFIEFMYVAGSALLLVLGGYVIIKGVFPLTLGTLVAFSACVVHIYGPAKALARSYESLQESLAGADRVFEMLEMEPEKESPNAVDIDGVREGIRFEDIEFHYSEGVPVLKDVSFVCDAGTVTAIVGKTGSGKSTLFSLLLRFYDPVTGTIRVDGRPLREIKRQSIREQIAVVGQDPFLFHTTIRENIRLGREDATEEEIVAAARAAHIHDEILELENGYETVVGERGAKLSGGQRQRVTIARAFLKNAPILLLDEATSSLDSESEQVVQEALDSLMEGRTTLIIAHRLSTIRNADQIVVLEEGQIREKGTHEELIARDGIYANLARLNEMVQEEPAPASSNPERSTL